MKILKIIDTLDLGGTEKVFVDLANILSENEVEVEIYCLLKPSVLDKELNSNIKINYLNRKNKANLFFLFKLYKKIKDFTILHIHSRQVMRYVGLLYLIPFIKLPKIVFQDHYGLIENDKSIDFILSKVLNKIDGYIAVSSQLLEWFNNLYPEKKSFLLPNIIRVKTSNKVYANKKQNSILMIGNFREQKNYSFAISIIKELPTEFTLTILGQKTDNQYYKKIKKEIFDKKISDRVNIITNVKEVFPIIPNFDIAMHTANTETGPLVAIEYLANKIPFLMYKTGYVSSILNEKLPEYLMQDFNVFNWVNKIKYLLNNRNNFIPQNEIIFKEYFSEQNYLNGCLKIYKNI